MDHCERGNGRETSGGNNYITILHCDCHSFVPLCAITSLAQDDRCAQANCSGASQHIRVSTHLPLKLPTYHPTLPWVPTKRQPLLHRAARGCFAWFVLEKRREGVGAIGLGLDLAVSPPAASSMKRRKHPAKKHNSRWHQKTGFRQCRRIA
ncbi:hypothetical protein CCHR01_02237 [Colletotrichum chrysophilum]|uniref:Uncharacterized protein n=1 Tax=Colletotrichum chrysophilum TaxID=1836956 RepID=A0AAD9AX92_9PEZI|nr:hypothetical protein CCHR01_02237 [Colletotrichum chrysophilum]